MTPEGVINMGVSREGEGMIGKCCPTGIKKRADLNLRKNYVE